MMSKRLTFRVLLLFFFAFSPLMVSAQNANAVYQEGLNKMKSKSYKEAIVYFKTAKEIGKGNSKLIKDCNSKIGECNRLISPRTHTTTPVRSFVDTLAYENRLSAFKDSISFPQHGGYQLKQIPVRGGWTFTCEPQEAREWLSVNRDEEARIPTLTIISRRNYTTSQRKAVVRVKGMNYKGVEFDESFEVTQTKAEKAGQAPLPVFMSLVFTKKGGKQVVKLPRDTELEIPDNVYWCFKSEFKYQEGSGKLKKTWKGVSNFFVKLLGGLPKTEFCDEDELVIETAPNETGSVRSTNIIVPGKGSINISQDK